MGIWLGPRGKASNKRPPKFASTGTLGTDYLYQTETDGNGIVHFEIAVLNPCSFTFSSIVPVDLFMVGSGMEGKTGAVTDLNGYPDDYGGDGGDGGLILQVNGVTIQTGQSYLLNPGVNGADTVGFGYSTANSTTARKKGGRGARSYGNAFGQSHHADPGENGAYAFGDASGSILFPNTRFGPGGGGGGVKNRTYYVSQNSAAGGEDGGGAGGTSGVPNGTKGAANRGAGSGGGYTFNAASSGLPGGSGILLIRDAR